MMKATRYLVLCGVLALSAAPVFASGPGGTDPPPPPTKTGGASSTDGTSSSVITTSDVVTALLAYLGL